MIRRASVARRAEALRHSLRRMRRRQPGFILIVISALVALALLVAVGWYALDGGSEEPARDLVGLTEVAAVREVQTRRLQVRIVRSRISRTGRHRNRSESRSGHGISINDRARRIDRLTGRVTVRDARHRLRQGLTSAGREAMDLRPALLAPRC